MRDAKVDARFYSQQVVLCALQLLCIPRLFHSQAVSTIVGTICVVVLRGSAGLACSEVRGISDPLLSYAPEGEPFRSELAAKLDLRDENPGASRRFLLPSIDNGVMEVRFPIPAGIPENIVDILRLSRKFT